MFNKCGVCMCTTYPIESLRNIYIGRLRNLVSMTATTTSITTHIFSVENVTKYYDHFLAVENIAFKVETNQIIALLGSNGAGKSTTLKMLCGLSKPTSGSISILGLSFTKDATKIKSHIGYVPEESPLYEDVTVMQYLLFFGSLYGMEKSLIVKRATKLLADLDLNAGNKIIAELSKGMKRKVLLARSLLHDPKVLIYDEPASGLDPQTASFILTFMQKLQHEGKTILFSSHNLAHVEKVAQRVLIIHKGKKIFDGTVKELTSQKQSKYTVTYYDSEDLIHTKTMHLEELNKFTKEHNIQEIVSHQPTVEDAFFSLINK